MSEDKNSKSQSQSGNDQTPPKPIISSKPDPALVSQMTKGEKSQPIQKVEVAVKADPNLQSAITFNERSRKSKKIS